MASAFIKKTCYTCAKRVGDLCYEYNKKHIMEEKRGKPIHIMEYFHCIYYEQDEHAK